MTERNAHCIKDTHADNEGKTWCGRDIVFDWCFVSIDHAAMVGRNDGSQSVCAKCVDGVEKALDRISSYD